MTALPAESSSSNFSPTLSVINATGTDMFFTYSCDSASSAASMVIKSSAILSTIITASAPAFCAKNAFVVNGHSPRFKSMMFAPYELLVLNAFASNSAHPSWSVLGYLNDPTNVAPYNGTPKLAIAMSYFPFNLLGKETVKEARST
jgi:hypothetical protein